MSDSAALRAWRRRALGSHEGARRWPSPKAALVSAAAVGAVCAVLGGRVGTDGGRAVEDGRATRPQPVAEAAPSCPVVVAPLHADVDGDGCDEDISFADGVLVVGAVRMSVGAPGDQVALGRWTCGSVIVALLRTSTGEVFRFDGWATQATTVPAVALGRVEGANGLRAAPRSGRHCDDLVVTRGSGPPVLLPERPVAG